jgi:hypothetical protein
MSLRSHLIATIGAAASALIIVTPAVASNWRNIATNASGSTYEIDGESIAREGNSVTFWVRVKYGPGSTRTGQSDGYTARRTASCSDYSFRDLQTDYTRDGAPTHEEGPEEIRYASPDSVAHAVIAAACSQ